MILQLVELKNGETYNGHLVCCDSWMNINLREVICTSRVSFLIEKFLLYLRIKSLIRFGFQDGDKFWRMSECYIRGITIKYIRIPDEVIDMMKEDMTKTKARGDGRPGRGAPGQRGRNAPRGMYLRHNSIQFFENRLVIVFSLISRAIRRKRKSHRWCSATCTVSKKELIPIAL